MAKEAGNLTFQLSSSELFYKSDDGKFMARFEQIDKNLVKFIFKGDASLVHAIQSMLILDKILRSVQQSGYSNPFYLIADLNEFKGTSLQARQHFVKGFTEYFHEGLIGSIALISPNWTIQSLGAMASKIYKNVKFSAHTNEKEALDTTISIIQHDQFLISTQKDLFDLFGEQVANNKEIELNGQVFLLKSLPYFKESTEAFSINALILNGQIIITKYKGAVNAKGIRKYGNMLKHAIVQSDTQPLFHIMDTYEITTISHAAKKALKLLDSEVSHYFNRSYFVLSSKGKMFYNMYKILFPDRVKKRILVSSCYTAINKIVKDQKPNVKPIENSASPLSVSRRKLQSATKEELLNIIEIQNEAMDKVWKNQQAHINELFEIIGRITWDESFVARELAVDSEDPFYNLYGAVSMLQKDVYEMIESLKQLNKTLEEKIVSRTKKLTQQNDDLKRINDEMDRFFYIIAHDLRAPLASLLGLTHLCRIELNKRKDPMIETYHDKIERSIVKMDSFITDITKYYKNKRLELKPEKIVFKQVVHNSLEDLYNLNDRNIQVKLDIQQTGVFYSDKIRLQIIMNNLISNAIRYSRQSDQKSTITVWAMVTKAMAEIKVKDNGQGIAEKHLDKIFEMFYRATTEKSGSGLGLYIVKEIVEKLKGTIHVESKIKAGTVFTIKIPTFKK